MSEPKYRIRPVAPDQWVVERKGWIFWHTFIEDETMYSWMNDGDYSKRFPTSNEAKKGLLEEIERRRKEAEERKIRIEAIEKHLSQPTIYI